MASIKGKCVQTLTTVFLALVAYAIAFSNSWPSYSFKVLESADSPIGYKITSNEKNLIGSIGMLGSMIGVMLIGVILTKIGPKRTAILSGIGSTLGWSILTTAHSGTQIIIGRFIFGLFTGPHLVTIMFYIADISETSLRGPLVCAANCIFTMGSLVSFLEGWFCSYDVVNYSLLVLLVVYTLLMLCIKDAPGYLLKKGKEKEALNALKFYRGVSKVNEDILKELLYIKSLQHEQVYKTDFTTLDPEKDALNKEFKSVVHVKQPSTWKILLKSVPSRRALLMVVIEASLAAFMGMIAVQAYAGQMFQQAVPQLSADFCSVLLALVIIASTALSVFTTDLLPRRVLFISTSALCAGCLAILASMIRWSWAPQWAIPMVVVVFSVIYHLGVIVVAFVQMAECFSPQVSGLANSIVMGSMFLSNFLVLVLFQPISVYLGLDGVFFVFSLISVLTTVFGYFFVKETRRLPVNVAVRMFEQGYLYRKQVT